MDWILSLNWTWFLIRLIILVVITPLMGFILVRLIAWFESAWKSNIRSRRWIACMLAFFGLSIAFGWFR